MAVEAKDLNVDTSLRSRARQAGMRVTDTTRADRINRAILSALALLIGVGAALALATSYGAFGENRTDRPIITADLVDRVHDSIRWIWLAVAVVAAAVVLLALRWILRMIVPGPSPADLHYAQTPENETTTVAAPAIAGVVVAELDAISGVSDTVANVSPDGLTISARSHLAPTADVAAVRHTAEDRILPRLRGSLGREDLALHLELRPSPDAEVARVQ